MAGARAERVDDLFFVDQTASGNPAEEGLVRLVSGDLVSFVGGALKSLTESSAGITESEHENLDTLTHSIAEDSFEEIVRTAGKVSSVSHYTDATKTTKIREVLLQRTSGAVTQIDNIQYDGTGTEVQRTTGTVVRVSGKVSHITWVESP